MAGNALRLVISISASADSARSVAQRLRFRRFRRGQRASSRNLSLKPWTFSPIKGRSLSRRDGEPASRAGLCWRCRRHSRPRRGTDHDSKPLPSFPGFCLPFTQSRLRPFSPGRRSRGNLRGTAALLRRSVRSEASRNHGSQVAALEPLPDPLDNRNQCRRRSA
jgi:hypothetical protein